MAKEWAKEFYASAIWHKQRAAYIRYRFGLCERCGMPGKIVHHRRELTPANIGDERVALGFDNLELLCQDCHNAQHHANDAAGEGLAFDGNGDLIRMDTPRGPGG